VPNGRIAPSAFLGLVIACSSQGNLSSLSSSQSTTEIPLPCDTCTVQLRSKIVLGSDDDSVAIQRFSRPVSISRNRYLVAPAGDMAQILEFDSSGRWIGILGKKGMGPGEFDLIKTVIALSSNQYAVLDWRFTLLSSDMAYRFSRNLPSQIRGFRGLPAQHGGLVLNNFVIPGRPFWVFDSTLSPVRSFGDSFSGANPDVLQYQLAADHEGGFWAAKASYRMVLSHYTMEGTLLKQLLPASTWFIPSEPPAVGSYEDPHSVRPRSRVTGLWVDPQHRLWLVGITADQDWKAVESPPSNTRQEQDYKGIDRSDARKLYDSFIEVVDPRSGRVTASRWYDGVIAGITAEGEIWEYIEETSGGLRIRLIEASLDSR
jgi:hypothetical protein